MSVIYCLISESMKLCYIGQTKYPKNRLHVHNSHHKLYQQGKFHYLTSYDVVQHPDCKFMMLKHVPLLESLHSAERSMIDYMRTQQEYKIVNKK